MRDNLYVPVVNGDVEGALRRLKKQYVVSGLAAAVNRHKDYRKPGEAKRIKSAKARKKAWKAAKRVAVLDYEAPGQRRSYYKARP